MALIDKILEAWKDWHKDCELVPRPNISFERGFKYGYECAKKELINDN